MKKGCFRLAVPARICREEAIRFLTEHEDWIQSTGNARLLRWEPRFTAGERHFCLGREVTLGNSDVPAGEAFVLWREHQFIACVQSLRETWEPRLAVHVPSIRIRRMYSRWGSCNTATHEIHLAARLAAYPAECIEYVLIHELCHYRVPEHSKAFYAAMDVLLPDWKQRKRLLNCLDVRPKPPEALSSQS